MCIRDSDTTDPVALGDIFQVLSDAAERLPQILRDLSLIHI